MNLQQANCCNDKNCTKQLYRTKCFTKRKKSNHNSKHWFQYTYNPYR